MPVSYPPPQLLSKPPCKLYQYHHMFFLIVINPLLCHMFSPSPTNFEFLSCILSLLLRCPHTMYLLHQHIKTISWSIYGQCEREIVCNKDVAVKFSKRELLLASNALSCKWLPKRWNRCVSQQVKMIV